MRKILKSIALATCLISVATAANAEGTKTDRAAEILFCLETPARCGAGGLIPLEPNGEWTVNPFEVWGPSGTRARAERLHAIEQTLDRLDATGCTTDADCCSKFKSICE